MRAALTGARSLVLATILVPVVLLSRFFFPYVSARNIFFRACVLLALGLFILAATGWRNLIPRGDRTFRWMCFYALAMIISALFGASPWHSFFGEFERMGGIIAWLALLLFYVLMRTLMTEDWRIWFARGVLIIADFGVIFSSNGSLPGSFSAVPRSISSGGAIGNGGLLGAYLLLCVVFSVYLLINERGGWRVFAGVSAGILLTGIAFSLNRSSQLGLIAGTGVAAGTFFGLSATKRRLAGIYGAGAAGLLIIALAGSSILRREFPVLSSDLFDRWIAFAHAPVDQSRIVEWKVALKGFLDRPLLGYGSDNYSVIRSIHFDPAAYPVSGFEQFDHPHNTWLELLCTGGMLGLIVMLGIWGSAIVALRDGARSRKLRPSETALFAGALMAYAVYLTFWFFDLNSTMLFVAMLALLSAKVYGINPAGVSAPGFVLPKWITIGAVEAALAVAVYFVCVVPLGAALDLGTALDPQATASARLQGFERSVTSGAPQAVRGLDFFDVYLGQVVSEFSEANVPAEQRDELGAALGIATNYATSIIRHEPLDDHSYVERGRIEKLAGDFAHDSAQYVLAERDLLRAIAMSPRRAETRAILSNFYLASGDTTAAVAQLDTASVISPVFNASHLRLMTVAMARKPAADSVTQLRSRSRQGIRKRL
jgi:O-antigen ligase